MRALFQLLFLSTFVWASGGELTLFVFKDGTPLAKTEVIIDANQSYVTDTDGALLVVLPQGKHQAVINVYNNKKSNCIYFN